MLVPFIRFLMWKVLILCLIVGFATGYAVSSRADTDASIDVAYTVRIDQGQQQLKVSAVFQNIQTEKLLIGFSNSFIWSKYAGTNLADRISELNVTPEKVNIYPNSLDDDLDLYSLVLNGQKGFTLSYVLTTAKIPYDVHFTALTPSTLHIPGLDFFVKAFKSRQEVAIDNTGLSLFGNYTIRIENLPLGWEIVSSYPQIDEQTVVIDDRWGGEILLSAGLYQKTEFTIGDATIVIAFDKQLALNHEEYYQTIEDVFQHYYSIYRHIPESEILVVINRDPSVYQGASRSIGGQVKRQNVINSVGWGRHINQNLLKGKLLGHLAHEIHHIWLSHGFDLKENWYWFQEGFTEYISEKSLLGLGLVSREYFEKEIAARYKQYDALSIKSVTTLVEASLKEKPDSDEIALIYGKGMLVAYLIDKRLQSQGKSIEILLSDFYRKYALQKTPVGNQEIISHINSYLGDHTFTKTHVLGTDSINSTSLSLGWKYYWWIAEYYLPPLSFPYNILVAIVVVLSALLLIGLLIRFIRIKKLESAS